MQSEDAVLNLRTLFLAKAFFRWLLVHWISCMLRLVTGRLLSQNLIIQLISTGSMSARDFLMEAQSC